MIKIKTILFSALAMTIFFVPAFSIADVDLSKGLFQSQDNQNSLAKFLSGNPKTEFTAGDKYPVPLFISRYGANLTFRVSTDKNVYNPGDTIKLSVKAVNPEGSVDPANNIKKGFYIWSGGNFFAKIQRESEDVPNGKLVVAEGYLAQESDILLSNKNDSEFHFGLKTPENIKSGTYEIILYPTSGNMMTLRGRPEGEFDSPVQAKVQVVNKGDKEETVQWDLKKFSFNNEIIKPKEKTFYLDNSQYNEVTVPLVNKGKNPRKIMVLKKVWSLVPFGEPIDSEEEEISLEPGKETTIKFQLNQEKLKEFSNVLVELRFTNSSASKTDNLKQFLSPSLLASDSEAVTNIFSIKGNLKFVIKGMGVTTPDFPWKGGNWLSYFMEVQRDDPLFYSSGGKERAEEKNVSLNLTLFDRTGNKIQEIGYNGPSWDRDIEISKVVTPHQKRGDYDYLKLVGVVKDKDGKELDRQEIEYDAKKLPANSLIQSNGSEQETSKLKYVKYALAGAVGIIVLLSSVLALLAIRRKTLNR